MFIDLRERGWEREREREREREKIIHVTERNIDWLPPVPSPTRDRNHNLVMCPEWGSNPQPFGLWNDASTN